MRRLYSNFPDTMLWGLCGKSDSSYERERKFILTNYVKPFIEAIRQQRLSVNRVVQEACAFSK